MSDRVFVLGAGRAGRGISRALRASGIEVVGLHGRRAEDAPDVVSAGAIPAKIVSANIVIVAVRDGQLEDALRELLSAPLDTGAVVLHASGSLNPRALRKLRLAGYRCGTFHPLVPIADPSRAASLFRGAFVGLEGDREAIDAGERLAAVLGSRPVRIPSDSAGKARYHAAAVMASNFPTVLAALATELLTMELIPREQAWAVVRALMRAAVANLDTDDPATALTGPIVRGDVDTVRRHLEALAERREDLHALYEALSRAAVSVAYQAGTDRDALRAIDELLEG